MAADVTSLIRILNGGGGDQNSPSGLITRDLLGGGGGGGSGGGGGGSGGHRFLDSKELDLDMQVPSGWEKRLDLKSGKVYLQRCESSNSSSSSDHNKKSNKNNNVGLSKFQDLNLPPSMKHLLDEPPSLELKLVPSSSSESPSASPLNYQSVCTLDKVKSALERAERLDTMRKRSISMSSSPASNSSSSIKDWSEADDHEERSGPHGGGGSFAAGCPKCLLYVLISVENPRCPGCGTTVPLPRAVSGKKPRIDLNISM